MLELQKSQGARIALKTGSLVSAVTVSFKRKKKNLQQWKTELQALTSEETYMYNF